MKTTLAWPIAGVLVAIAATSTMDANGLSAFSALALLPLLALFWSLERHSRSSMGLTWGRSRHYGLALLYPLTVLGVLAIIATVAGAIDLSRTDWAKAALNFALIAGSTFIGALLTEEGFFRGWLWASLGRAGQRPAQVLVWSSIAFGLWHLSVVVFETDFGVPAAQVPVYIANAIVIGGVWGLMRWMSGSVIVASLCHGVWNGAAYVFFGFGTKVGALGIADTAIYGPEVGVVGLVLNVAFAATLWWWFRRNVAADRITSAASTS